MNKNYLKILKQWEKEFKKGYVSFLILLLLMEKEMYGYEVTNTLNNLSAGEIIYQESGIYQILKKLKKKKIVISFLKASHLGPKRKYYRITDMGRELVIQFGKKYVMSIHSQLERLTREQIKN